MPRILVLLLLAAGPALAEPVPAPPAAEVTAMLREAVRRRLCPEGGVPILVEGQLATGRCATVWWGEEAEIPGWDAGVATPTREQAACPSETRPVPAEAQPRVVRCLPE